MGSGNPSFYVDDPRGSRVGIINANEVKHSLHVGNESDSDVTVIAFAVVGLIRQRNAALFDKHHIALRVPRIVIDKQFPQPVNTSALRSSQGLE